METKNKIIPICVGEFLDFEKSIFTYRKNIGVKSNAPCIAWLILGEKEHVLVTDSGVLKRMSMLKSYINILTSKKIIHFIENVLPISGRRPLILFSLNLFTNSSASWTINGKVL